MGLTKMDSFGSEQPKVDYLDTTKLADGIRYRKVCLVVGNGAGISTLEKGFFKFYVKDVNSNIVRAMQFNIAEYIDSGFTALAFKNKPVEIDFIAQVYNGSWSLILKEITEWTDEFDYSIFRGSVACDSAWLKKLATGVFGSDETVTMDYSTSSLYSICGGRCGGYLKLVDSAARSLLNYKDMPTVNLNELLASYFYAMEVYFLYLKKKNEFQIIDQSLVYDMLGVMGQKVADSPFRFQILDACRSLLDNTKPQHLYAHLIYSTVKATEESFSLIHKNAGMPLGASSSIVGGELIRY